MHTTRLNVDLPLAFISVYGLKSGRWYNQRDVRVRELTFYEREREREREKEREGEREREREREKIK